MRNLQKIKLKKLNSTGIGHHLLIAILVITSIASLGAYRVWSSSAAVSSSSVLTVGSQAGCELAGRKWKSGSCMNKGDLPQGADINTLCRTAGDKYITSTATGHCASYIATSMTQATCTSLGRVFVIGAGCAQLGTDQDNSPRCYDVNRPNYNRKAQTGAADVCVAKAEVVRESDGEAGDLNITKGDCVNLLGRTFDDGANKCRRKCTDGSGILSNNNVYYCKGFVATDIASEDACVNYLNRKWVVAGCAKRPTEQNNSVQCKREAGFPNYYPNVSGTTDACHKTKALAKAAVEARNNASSSGAITPGAQSNGALGNGTAASKPPASTPTVSTAAKTQGSNSEPVDVAAASTTAKIPKPQEPTCTKKGKKVAANKDGSCPKGADLTCPGDKLVKKKDADGNERCYKKEAWQEFKKQQEDAAAADMPGSTTPHLAQPLVVLVVVSDNIPQDKCELLGREFLKKKKGSQPKGCLRACVNAKAQISANGKTCLLNGDKALAYAVPMAKETCDNLHRKYIGAVDMCAQFPNQEKKNGKKVNADQCEKAYPVYIILEGKRDECVTAALADQAKIVANKMGKQLASVVKLPNRQICDKLRKDMHWNGKQCVKDRKIVEATSDGQASRGESATGKGPQGSKDFIPSKGECKELQRKWSDSNGCAWSATAQANAGNLCQSGSLNYVKGSPYDMCKGYASSGPGICAKVPDMDGCPGAKSSGGSSHCSSSACNPNGGRVNTNSKPSSGGGTGDCRVEELDLDTGKCVGW